MALASTRKFGEKQNIKARCNPRTDAELALSFISGRAGTTWADESPTPCLINYTPSARPIG